ERPPPTTASLDTNDGQTDEPRKCRAPQHHHHDELLLCHRRRAGQPPLRVRVRHLEAGRRRSVALHRPAAPPQPVHPALEPRHCRGDAMGTGPNVPQVHRQVLQQLHLVLRHWRQRQVPPPAPTHRPLLRQLLALVDRHRRQPHKPGHRGGRQDVLRRSLRELGQGRHEPLLQGQHRGAQPGVQGARRGGGAQVSVKERELGWIYDVMIPWTVGFG
ncbi:hypothetical protein TOPH_03203, partial [Tolypocladium ophioglossoides CBS 100239]